MSDFLKRFLLEDVRRFSPNGRYLALGAFGKHPGWDDHVEDLGLETESLNIAKTVLYVNGIGGQIDSGAWEKLDAAQQLAAFKHVFVWQRAGQILVGRLWSSSDGKGRTRYPMVVCLHFSGVTLGWALKQALPALAELEEECLMTTSAAEVRTLLGRKRAALREAVQSTDGRGEYAPVSPDVLHRILQPASGVASEGFLRVLYQIQSQWGSFVTGKFKGGTSTVTLRAQQIRVPLAGENAEQALLFWTRFFLTQLDSSVPLLLTLPLEQGWVDVTAGEPESHECFCLRASPKAMPLVSEVPYKLEDDFRSKATLFLESFARGETKAAALKPATSVAVGPAPAPAKTGWRKWLGVGVILILGAAAAVIFLPKDRDRQAGVNPAAKPEPAKAVTRTEAAASLTPVPGSGKPDVSAKPRLELEAEAARLVEDRQKSNAMVAAAKLKTEAETAAAREKERQTAEAAAAKKRADDEARQKLELAAASAPKASSPKAASPAAPTASVRREMTNSIGMVLVLLPSGIWAGKYEVTQAEYRKMMGVNPSKSINDRQPVERVGWDDAQEFCRKLTDLERGQLPLGNAHYHLPTERQWDEIRAGQRFEDLPGGGLTGRWWPSLVGQTGPTNKLGLFDVLGNVWEWCQDGATGDEKLLKGGAFNSNTNYDRKWLPGNPVSNCGFRCVLAP